jgi:uncharacterized protein YkwD
MYRVALAAALAVTLAGCSLGSVGLSSGFAEGPSTASVDASSSFASKDSSAGSALGSAPKTERAQYTAAAGTKVAALPDKAPTGTFEKAPAGALQDRDYSGTSLNPEMARDLINQYRREKGLKPLKLNPALTEAAKEHSRDLAKWDRISHYGSDGSNPWDRVKRSGYKAKLAAENVGTGQVNFDEVLRGWKESAGHNKNLLLGDAQEMGLALVQDPKTEFKSFWTLVVGASM